MRNIELKNNEADYFCIDCKPNWKIIGELTEKYFLVYDRSTNQYLIGDIAGHADSIYVFSKKPEPDPIQDWEDEPHEDSPLWDESSAWIDQWQEDRDNFKFTPNIAYDLVVSFTNEGWAQRKNGDLFYYIVNFAGRIIQTYERETSKLHQDSV